MAASSHQGEWVQQVFAEFTTALADEQCRRNVLRAWEKSTPEEPHQYVVRGAMVFRDDATVDLKRNLAITDAKPLYDALYRNGLKAKEKQVALVTSELKQTMGICGFKPRWLPHNEMICDPLTKALKKSNMKPLVQFLKTGKLRLTCEGNEMQYRQTLKESGGKIMRLKGKGLQEDEYRDSCE